MTTTALWYTCEVADGFVAEAQWRRDDWERRPAGWGDGDFDGSAAPSQVPPFLASEEFSQVMAASTELRTNEPQP